MPTLPQSLHLSVLLPYIIGTSNNIYMLLLVMNHLGVPDYIVIGNEAGTCTVLVYVYVVRGG